MRKIFVALAVVLACLAPVAPVAAKDRPIRVDHVLPASVLQGSPYSSWHNCSFPLTIYVTNYVCIDRSENAVYIYVNGSIWTAFNNQVGWNANIYPNSFLTAGEWRPCNNAGFCDTRPGYQTLAVNLYAWNPAFGFNETFRSYNPAYFYCAATSGWIGSICTQNQQQHDWLTWFASSNYPLVLVS